VQTAVTTDYNHIAAQYRKAKQQPWRSAVEEYSLLKLVGNLAGKKVIDIACGEGFFTRKLKQRGAATVVGVDISREMVALAQAQEAQSPLGIEYLEEDARAAGPQQDFDLAVAAWLLVYAHDRDELAVMCRGLARRLKPGGRFATLTTNPHVYSFERLEYRKYGFDVRLEDHVYEGATIVWTTYLDDTGMGVQGFRKRPVPVCFSPRLSDDSNEYDPFGYTLAVNCVFFWLSFGWLPKGQYGNCMRAHSGRRRRPFRERGIPHCHHTKRASPPMARGL